MDYTTQMDAARKGIITKELQAVAEKEQMDTAFYSLDKSIHLTAEVTNQCLDNTFSSGCCFVDVEVDMPLGLVTVKDIINVHDSGILINPKTAEARKTIL